MSPIVIAGASVRAAAQSARRAGFQPYAIDCFADVDLQSLCPVQQVVSYPHDVLRAAQRHPVGPWMYTGALENYPEVIEAVTIERPLLGNRPDVVRAVRDPWQLAQCFAARNIPFPDLFRAGDRLPHGEWVCKPYRSGGGLNIQRFRVDRPELPPPTPTTHYWQRFVAGSPISGVFVGSRRRAELLGITRQLIGCTWAGATGHMYVGSIGPVELSRAHRCQMEQIGASLTEAFDLTGLFGIDAIGNEKGVWTIEVNPRYTASVEVLERAGSLRSIARHVDACSCQPLSPLPLETSQLVHGKAVVYATRPTRIRRNFTDWVERENRTDLWPGVADIPQNHSLIQSRHPVCTVFAEGPNPAAIEQQLRNKAETARVLLDSTAED